MPSNFTDSITVNGWSNLMTALQATGYTGASVPNSETTLLNFQSTPAYIHFADSASTAPNVGGVAQVETQTVVVTTVGAGNAKSVVTAAGVTGSPVTVTFAVANNDTASQVATKMKAALTANTAIAAVYTIGGSGADVTLTQITRNGNDGTLNFTIEDVTSSGITDDLTSVDTTAGVHAGLSGLQIASDTAAAPSSAFTLPKGTDLATVWLYTASSIDVKVAVSQG